MLAFSQFYVLYVNHLFLLQTIKQYSFFTDFNHQMLKLYVIRHTIGIKQNFVLKFLYSANSRCAHFYVKCCGRISELGA